MEFRTRPQELRERAARLEDDARRVEDPQAQDLLRALALLYREMSEELEESGLFERRFDAVVCADLARAVDQ